MSVNECHEVDRVAVAWLPRVGKLSDLFDKRPNRRKKTCKRSFDSVSATLTF